MNNTANQAITGAIATAKANSSKIKSVKIKIKMGNDKEDSPKKKGLSGWAKQSRAGAKAMSWKGPVNG